ncbi:MAG: hypothetical protein D6B28_10425 [Gammaproteobacteria bacterium]|nr:MAG: hypothetical protein D6B28_10425 [Gammaproteobacteria bacterium]
MKSILISLCILLCTVSFSVYSNPFISGKPKAKQETVQLAPKPAGTFHTIFAYQQKIYKNITAKLKEYKNNQTVITTIIILAMAFFYGVLHAVGPGHGKAFAGAYFVSNQERIKRAIYLGGLIAFFHTLTSVLIVVVLKFILDKFSIITFDNVSSWTRLISFSLISIIGAGLLTSVIYRIVKKQNHHEHSKLGFWGVVFSVGLVPCPGAMIILIFTNSLDIFHIGIFMVIAMSLGMAVTISTAGILAVIGRKAVVSGGTASKINTAHLFNGIQMIGALLVLGLGLFFLLGEIGV